MTFDEMLSQVQDLLQREQRVSYRGLKRRFALDDEYLEDLKEELIKARRVAVDEDGSILVWVEKGINGEKDKGINGELKGEKAKGVKGEDSPKSKVQGPESKQVQGPRSKIQSQEDQSPVPSPQPPAAERRQLTVMFCDLVGSTALSTQLDPEELREVVRAYQETCTAVIRHYDGYVAQHLGDGMLVYFGYPVAHEDDAARAVRAGLEILAALQQAEVGARRHRALTNPTITPPLQVRIGIHTGLVVIGEIGSSEKREILALGETPNLAARIQGQANPDEVIISAATYRLIEGLFTCEDRG